MAGPIQALPQGLLGLLQLKETGRNPSVMVETVSPNIELLEFFMQRQMQNELGLFGGSPVTVAVSTVTETGFAVGGVTCQIPANQTWWIERLSVKCSFLAADYARFVPVIVTPNTSSYSPCTDYNDVVTARARAGIVSTVGGFWLPPQSIFSLKTLDCTSAGGIVFNLALRAVPVPI